MELEADTDPPRPPPLLRSSRWSELMEEVLFLLLSRLILLSDISRFGSVCSSWRSAMLSYRNLLRPPPLLVAGSPWPSPNQLPNFFYPQSLDHHHPALHFINLPHPFPVFPPAVTTSCENLRFMFSGAGYLGYVASKHRRQHHYLINPITRQHLNLPSTHGFLPHIAFTSNPIPASDDCTVLAIFNYNGTGDLLLCKPGDTEWTSCLLQGSQKLEAHSMTFHKGKLYALVFGRTSVFALDPPHLKPLVKIDPPIEFDSIYSQRTFTFLVESGGDLLLVLKKHFLDKNFKPVEIIFKVFKLEDERWWKRITNLGDDRVLLLSIYGVDSFSNKEVMRSGFRSNCIYDLCHGDCLWVYSIEDESIARVSLPSGNNDGQVIRTWLVPLGW